MIYLMNNFKQYIFIFLLGVFQFSIIANASSTFVGNGGNSRDLDLQVTLSQLKDLSNVIENKNTNSAALCTCDPNYAEFNFCVTLSRLSEPQQKYCSDFVVNQNKALKAIHQNNLPQIEWTEESMTVQDGTQIRAVEAVTNFNNRKITLQRETFSDLKAQERIFLLAHEFYHLTELENKPLVDNAHYGPFDSDDGGKLLLNAASAAQTQLAYKNGIISNYAAVLKRSRYTQRHHVSMGLYSQNSNIRDDNNFGFTRANGFELKYRFQPDMLGLAITLTTSQAEKELLTTIHTSEMRSAQRLGVTLRSPIKPDSPDTFLGQCHVVLEPGIEIMSGEYEVKESDIRFNETTKSMTPYLTLGIYSPLQNDYWIYFEGTLHQTKLNYKELDLQTSINNSFNVGFSYGF